MTRAPFPVGCETDRTSHASAHGRRETDRAGREVASIASGAYDITWDGDPRQADAGRHRSPLGRPVGRRWHLPVRHVGRTVRRLLDRHPTPDRQRLAPHGPRVQLHPHRPHRPLPADARQAGLLPDGLGRQRSAHRAPRAELLRRALRPARAVPSTASSHRSAATHRRSTRRSRSRVPTSSSSATNSSRWTRRCSRRCTAASV